jgi:hypothetical protein
MAKKDKSLAKVDMVRDAIGKLGWDAAIEAYQKYIKEVFGAEMSKPHISQTKSNEKKRQGIRRRRRGRPAANAEAAATSAVPLADILSFVSEVQHWEQKIGAKTIRKVVDKVLKS